MGARSSGDAFPSEDPLDALEARIDEVLSDFECGGSSWDDVEAQLTEGYAKLLAVETLCLRLDAQLGSHERQADEGNRELEEFRRTLVADSTRLRDALGRFRSRGIEARRLRFPL